MNRTLRKRELFFLACGKKEHKDQKSEGRLNGPHINQKPSFTW